MNSLKIKVCGMGTSENIKEVAALQPDYLGFIFYEKSARDFTGTIPDLQSEITKVGVFVNAEHDFIIKKVHNYQFEAIQLHGEETPAYCEQLKKALRNSSNPKNIAICKVFGIKDTFDFDVLKDYEPYIDYFLFDTKGKQKGGNGYAFDWGVLKNYPSNKPFMLSGGIGPEHIEEIQKIKASGLPIFAIDINSKFEDAPAQKDAHKIKEFIQQLAV